jgi:hypothetical protein
MGASIVDVTDAQTALVSVPTACGIPIHLRRF